MSLTDENSEGQQVDIVRDHTFRHFSADTSMTLDFGHDFELSFMRLNTRPITKELPLSDDAERSRVKFERQEVEVARIRLAPSAALQLVMQTLQRLVQGDHVVEELLKPEIVAILESTSESVQSGAGASE